MAPEPKVSLQLAVEVLQVAVKNVLKVFSCNHEFDSACSDASAAQAVIHRSASFVLECVCHVTQGPTWLCGSLI